MSLMRSKEEVNTISIAGVPLLAGFMMIAACSPAAAPNVTKPLAVTANPNPVTVAQNQSVTMRVDIPGLAVGQNISGYSIDLPETTADIDIATGSCPSGVGTSACQDWTITPGPNSVPGRYTVAIGATEVLPASVTLTVTANPRDPLPGAIAADVNFDFGSSLPNKRTHILFVTSDNRLWGFGVNSKAAVRGVYLRNIAGTVQSSEPNQIDEPVAIGPSTFRWRIPLASGFTDLFGQSVAIRDDGTVWGWGENENGDLGFLSNPNDQGIQLIPAQVPGLTNIVAISTEGLYRLALDSDGQVYVWGNVFEGSPPAPQAIPNLTDVLQIAGGMPRDASFGNAYIRTANLHVSKIIKRTAQDPHEAVGDIFGGPVDAIAAGADHVLAIQAQQVLAFGKNDQGQLGDGTMTDRPCDLPDGPCVNPASVLVGTVSAIAARGDRSFALVTDGTVWTWGAGILRPVQVPGLNNVQIIGAGSAIRADCAVGGSLWEISFGEEGTSPPTAVRVPRVGETADCIASTFALALGDAALTLSAVSDQQSTAINLTRSGFSGAVDLTVLDCPANVSCTPNPNSIPNGANTGVLTISTNNATPGNYVITVRGSGGGVTREAFLELHILGL